VDNLVLPNIYATYKYKAPLIGPNPLYSQKVDRHQEKMVQDMITKNLSIDPALLSLQAYEANFRNHHRKSNHTLSLKESQQRSVGKRKVKSEGIDVKSLAMPKQSIAEYE